VAAGLPGLDCPVRAELMARRPKTAKRRPSPVRPVGRARRNEASLGKRGDAAVPFGGVGRARRPLGWRATRGPIPCDMCQCLFNRLVEADPAATSLPHMIDLPFWSTLMTEAEAC
jgi:hypothetical protein